MRLVNRNIKYIGVRRDWIWRPLRSYCNGTWADRKCLNHGGGNGKTWYFGSRFKQFGGLWDPELREEKKLKISLNQDSGIHDEATHWDKSVTTNAYLDDKSNLSSPSLMLCSEVHANGSIVYMESNQFS